VGDYPNSEGSDEEMLEIGSTAHIEITVQGDETEGVKPSRLLKLLWRTPSSGYSYGDARSGGLPLPRSPQRSLSLLKLFKAR